MAERETLKPLDFIGSSREELKEFPGEVKQDIGYALFEAQKGQKSEAAKPLKGFGSAGVLEIIERFDGDTYRAVYTVKFREVVYVLHCFQKKSKSGVKTPQQDIELIRRRLKAAEKDDRTHHQRGG
jgi:phage-related protein